MFGFYILIFFAPGMCFNFNRMCFNLLDGVLMGSVQHCRSRYVLNNLWPPMRIFKVVVLVLCLLGIGVAMAGNP